MSNALVNLLKQFAGKYSLDLEASGPGCPIPEGARVLVTAEVTDDGDGVGLAFTASDDPDTTVRFSLRKTD